MAGDDGSVEFLSAFSHRAFILPPPASSLPLGLEQVEGEEPGLPLM